MKVALLQFNPDLGQTSKNMSRAEALIDDADLHEVDWLILPELAFTGYNFSSLEAIAPHLEQSAAGVSTIWAKRIAHALSCYVSVGYPEICNVDGDGKLLPSDSPLIRRYNSLVTVSPSQEVVVNYRKTFLYYTDETWANKGDGFFHGDLGTVLGNVTVGICMDINPEHFSPENLHCYEFANAIASAGAPISAMSMAFTTHQTPAQLAEQPGEPDFGLLGYWIERMLPLIVRGTNERYIVLFANRWGAEGSVCYGGTSAILEFCGGAVRTYGILGKAEDGILTADLDDSSNAREISIQVAQM